MTPTEQEAKLTELGTRFEILIGIVIGLVGAIISTRDTLHKLASQPTLLLSQSDRKDIAAEIAELGRRTEKAITDLDEVMKLGGRQ